MISNLCTAARMTKYDRIRDITEFARLIHLAHLAVHLKRKFPRDKRPLPELMDLIIEEYDLGKPGLPVSDIFNIY